MDTTLTSRREQPRQPPVLPKQEYPHATFGVSPAIANALHDAVGVRLTSLPLTPEAVLRAMRAARGDNPDL